MEDITNTDYRHVKRVLEVFQRKNLGKYTIYMFEAEYYG